jgi:transketolase
VEAARAADRPTLIACKTVIGYGAPTRAGKSKSHGEPLGAEEIAGARKALDWPHAPFEIPADILAAWRAAGARGAKARADWETRLAALPADKGAEFSRRVAGDLPAGLSAAVEAAKAKLIAEAPEMATRKSGEAAIKVLAPVVPELVTGSADLTGSNNTKVDATPAISPGNFAGRFVHWGIREHGMAAALNGMALHGGFIPSGATFLVFTDYCRPAIRLAALMGQRVVHVMTHDSIGLGEDGPTHQPVEHLAALRAIPNTLVLRPCDAVETLECWQIALETKGGPSVLALTRQNLPALRRAAAQGNLSARGAYEISPAAGEAQVSLFATGSEVAIAVAAQKLLADKGVPARVVSVPSFELFRAQDAAYRAATLGAAKVRIGVEAAIRMGWDEIVGSDGGFVGMTGFGASAPAKQLYAHFGLTAEAVAGEALKRLGRA